MCFFVFVYSVVNVFYFFLMLTFLNYLFRRIFVFCGAFYIETTHDCVCPFCMVLLFIDFLAPAIVFDDDPLLDSFATS